MDRAEKRRRIKAWKEVERHAARTRLPLSDGDMELLFDVLEHGLAEMPCDHTLRITDAWLAEHGHAPARLHRWLNRTGGFCDCEVLQNSEQAWR